MNGANIKVFLKACASTPTTRPVAVPERLPLDQIKENTEVFQARSGGDFDRKKHLTNLTRIIRQGAELDPILVYHALDEWYCIDGHVRLDAYQQAGASSIPCEPFEGTPEEAVEYSLKANRKDKLQLSKVEKLNACWALFTSGTGFTALTRDMGFAKGTVSNMRRKALQMTDAGEVPSDVTWVEARVWPENHHSETYDANKAAKELAERLQKTIGPVMHRSWHTFAEALGLVMGRRSVDVATVLLGHVDLEEDQVAELLTQLGIDYDEERGAFVQPMDF